jgi:hypothetical protein
MAFFRGPNVVTNGLVLALDAANTKSYTLTRNFLKYSNDFTNAVWTRGNTSITSSAAISPDGTQNATLIKQDTVNNRHVFYNTTFPSTILGNQYTLSFFVKPAGTTKLFTEFQWMGSQFSNAYFDVSTKTKIAGGLTPSYVDYSNGWTRVIITGTASTSSNSTNIVYPYIGLLDNSGSLSYTGDGTSGAYFYGFQMESGSTATDYIDYNTAWNDLSGNTYNGNLISSSFTYMGNVSYQNGYFNTLNNSGYMNNIQGISGSSFPQNSGSVSVWINQPQYYQTGTQPIFDCYSNGRNHFFIRHGTSNQIQIAAQDNINLAAYEAVFTENSLQTNTWYNITFTYVTGVSSSFKYYLNGALKGTQTFLSSSWRPSEQFVGYGNSTDAASIATGSYGPLSIYNRDLSASEIQQNYNALKSRFNLN